MVALETDDFDARWPLLTVKSIDAMKSGAHE